MKTKVSGYVFDEKHFHVSYSLWHSVSKHDKTFRDPENYFVYTPVLLIFNEIVWIKENCSFSPQQRLQ